LTIRAPFYLLFIIFPLVVNAKTVANTSVAVNQAQHQAPSIEKEKRTIPAFSANYTLLHKSDPVGKALRELIYLDDGQAVYHYETDIEWLIFSDARSETSTLSIDNGQVTPLHYIYKREGTGRDKNYEWRYQLQDKTATNVKKNESITLDDTNGLQDKLSYHLQNRLNLINNPEQKSFVYPVISTSGSVKDYTYIYDGEEELMLPYGLVKAIRLKRETPKKKRITYAWFAPELNYLLVKLYQVKAGTEQFEAQLSSVKVH
jgi:hypothetical protein